jgi:hypothetical protein
MVMLSLLLVTVANINIFCAYNPRTLDEKEKDFYYIDKTIDTKEELIMEIDLYIHEINIKINSSYFNLSNEKDTEELKRAKVFIKDLQQFREKVLISNDSRLQFLINEFDAKYKYRKIRIV